MSHYPSRGSGPAITPITSTQFLKKTGRQKSNTLQKLMPQRKLVPAVTPLKKTAQNSMHPFTKEETKTLPRYAKLSIPFGTPDASHRPCPETRQPITLSENCQQVFRTFFYFLLIRRLELLGIPKSLIVCLKEGNDFIFIPPSFVGSFVCR